MQSWKPAKFDSVRLLPLKVNKRSGGSRSSKTITFNAFGSRKKVLLEKNEKLLSKHAKLYFIDGSTSMEAQLPNKTDCHFLHNSEKMTAALSK